MFGLADLAWLGGALVAAWGMYEYLPGLLQRGLRRTTPQISGWDAPDVVLVDYGETPPARLPDMPATPGAMPTDAWRDALNESPHLLIYGPSKAGKSTLAQAVVAMFQGCEYLVIDPMPNKPGESKWGGIAFVTLDEHGSDEYASIKAALDAVQAEDDRRRRTMRTETHPPLIVIIDEVLALVGALGTVKNVEGKNEPRMSHFLRIMGYSARHRNIKIVLIGQGKNLRDLGLESSTARNNYALIRAARNAATNERSAFIDADGAEQAIDLRFVPMLAAQAAGRAHLWRVPVATPDADAMLEKLMGGAPVEPSAPAASDSGWTAQHIQVAMWLAAEPEISNRELGRRLYPGTDGGGSYSVKAKELRDQVLRVTGTGVTPLQNGQNTPFPGDV